MLIDLNSAERGEYHRLKHVLRAALGRHRRVFQADILHAPRRIAAIVESWAEAERDLDAVVVVAVFVVVDVELVGVDPLECSALAHFRRRQHQREALILFAARLDRAAVADIGRDRGSANEKRDRMMSPALANKRLALETRKLFVIVEADEVRIDNLYIAVDLEFAEKVAALALHVPVKTARAQADEILMRRLVNALGRLIATQQIGTLRKRCARAKYQRARGPDHGPRAQSPHRHVYSPPSTPPNSGGKQHRSLMIRGTIPIATAQPGPRPADQSLKHFSAAWQSVIHVFPPVIGSNHGLRREFCLICCAENTEIVSAF